MRAPTPAGMRVIQDVRDAREQFPHVVLTIGSFDGVHVGHQRIIAELVERARESAGTPALMTLRPHPREYFAPENAPNILTPEGKKEALLAEAGVAALYYLPFNADVAGMDRERFVAEIIAGRCGARHLVVGHDFAFGKNAEGDYAYLKDIAPRFGFTVSQVHPLVRDGERVSSTLIRERILQGEMERVRQLLGRCYSILGEVRRGRGIGAQLGYPTANIRPVTCAIPAQGVYAAEALVRGRRHVAAVNIGIAPTIRHEDLVIEAHLLDFSEDIVGEEIEVFFHHRRRPEKKFPSHEALIQAIDDDVAAIRAYFEQGAGRA